MKDYCVRKALCNVRKAAGMQLAAGSCTPGCGCSYCNRVRRQQQQQQSPNQGLRDQLTKFYREMERNTQIREQKTAEWEKTKRLLKMMLRHNTMNSS